METESERTFTYWLPSSWVFRGQKNDYGIDAEVEIFEDRRTTGMTFKVQLKGTDTDRRGRSIRIETLEYWRSLDVPVLVVFYESGTEEQLYGRWAHAHDPHVRPHHPAQQTTTFRFTDNERLTRDTLRGRLHEDVKRFRDARTGSLVEPLTYAVEFVNVLGAQRHHLALRRLLDSAPLHTSPTSADMAALRIECGPTKFRITGPVGLATLTVHTAPAPNPEQHAADIVAAMGFVLANSGAGAHAVNLLQLMERTSSAPSKSPPLRVLVSALRAGTPTRSQ